MRASGLYPQLYSEQQQQQQMELPFAGDDENDEVGGLALWD